MTLLMDNLRIDGIDHEERVDDHRGYTGTGWHRHIWNADVRHSEAKECLEGFGQFGSRLDFVRDACGLLGIELKEGGGEEDGIPGLLFS
jgi:hypothetical protein